MPEVECHYFKDSASGLNFCDVSSKTVGKGPIVFENSNNSVHTSDVRILQMYNVDFDEFPRNIHECFPNLEGLFIYGSDLDDLQRADIGSLTNLKFIRVNMTSIKRLRGDLFRDLKNLEEINFECNEIVEIEPDILDGLEKLRIVDFTRKNDFWFDKNNAGTQTLEQMKAKLKEGYDVVMKKRASLPPTQLDRIKVLEQENAKYKAENQKLSESLRKNQEKVKDALEGFRSDAASFKDEIGELRQKIEKLMGEKSSFSTEFQLLKFEGDNLQQKFAEEQQKLAAKRTECEALREKIEKMHDCFTEYRKMVKKLAEDKRNNDLLIRAKGQDLSLVLSKMQIEKVAGRSTNSDSDEE
jgi:chromosome segregation ATPase